MGSATTTNITAALCPQRYSGPAAREQTGVLTTRAKPEGTSKPLNGWVVLTGHKVQLSIPLCAIPDSGFDLEEPSR